MFIELGITQFARPVGGQSIPKDATIGFGGGYRLQDLPDVVEVVSGDTIDTIGSFRRGGDGGVRFRGTKEDLLQWNEEFNGW